MWQEKRKTSGLMGTVRMKQKGGGVSQKKWKILVEREGRPGAKSVLLQTG